MKTIILIPMFIFSFVYTSFSKTITAKSTSFNHVDSAVKIATIGDTVIIPSGISDWANNTLNVKGGIYIKGNGKSKTIIKRLSSSDNFLISFDGSNKKPCAISHLSLIGSYHNDLVLSKGLGLLYGCINFKVFNCHFEGFANCAIQIGNTLQQDGVIYCNEFVDNYYSSIGNYRYGIVVYGDGSRPILELGTKNAVFVEDNYFSGNRHNVASNNSSRYVFRYNQVIGRDPAKNFAMTDAHGLSSWPAGSRSFEIYNNEYSATVSSGLQRSAINIRGGDGVIFNNKCTNKISRTVELSIEGFSCGTYPGSDQILDLYIWGNEAHDELGYTTLGIANNCDSSVKLNRDYFLKPKIGYIPYTYPHPLRTSCEDELDVNQFNISPFLEIAPNPFSDKIVVKNSDGKIEHFKLFNAQGILMGEYDMTGSSSNEFDFSHLPSSLYIFYFKTQQGYFLKKILKQ